MSMTYEQAIKRKEELMNSYNYLLELRRENKVDPNGPYYEIILNEMGFKIIDDYGKRCHPIDTRFFARIFREKKPFTEIVEDTTSDLFYSKKTNFDSKHYCDELYVARRDYVFTDKDFCQSYLLYILDQGSELYDEKERQYNNELKELLKNNFDCFIKSEKNSIERCRECMQYFNYEIKQMIQSSCEKNSKLLAENERIVSEYNNNKKLINDLRNIRLF